MACGVRVGSLEPSLALKWGVARIPGSGSGWHRSAVVLGTFVARQKTIQDVQQGPCASMERTLPLLKGRITLEDALNADEDVVQALSYPEKRAVFWLYLDRRRSHISQVVSRHLNIPQGDFQLGDLREWIHGSFNVCVPIHITRSSRPDLPRRVLIRFPLPYKTGEEHFPGNVDEKLRCEAATYVWLQSNCPTVPIPRLWLWFSRITIGMSCPPRSVRRSPH